MKPILFKTKPAKVLEVLLYLAQRWNGSLALPFVCPLLYLAEKQHMTDWGRPVVGDVYVKLINTVEGSMVTKILDGRYNTFENAADIQMSLGMSQNSAGQYMLRALRSPNMDELSKSDVEALEVASEYLVSLGKADLNMIFKNQTEFHNASYYDIIGYETFVNEDEKVDGWYQELQYRARFAA